MIKCKVTEYFTLKKFNELENIVRANENNNTKDGELFVGDTFDCTEEMAKYLTGDNENKIVVVKIINGKKTNDDLKNTDEIKQENNEEEGQTIDKENVDKENQEEKLEVIIDEDKVKEIVVEKPKNKKHGKR